MTLAPCPFRQGPNPGVRVVNVIRASAVPPETPDWFPPTDTRLPGGSRESREVAVKSNVSRTDQVLIIPRNNEEWPAIVLRFDVERVAGAPAKLLTTIWLPLVPPINRLASSRGIEAPRRPRARPR